LPYNLGNSLENLSQGLHYYIIWQAVFKERTNGSWKRKSCHIYDETGCNAALSLRSQRQEDRSVQFNVLLSSSSSSGAEPLLIGGFGLLNDILPLCSILDTGYPIFFIFIWPRSCMMFSSHLCLGLPLGLVVKGFHLNTLIPRLTSDPANEFFG